MQVWPAHGAGSACGKGLGAIPSSTVGYEKLFNPALQIHDEQAFVDYILSDQPEAPKYFAVMKRVNKEGPAVLGEPTAPRPWAPADMPAALDNGMVLDLSPAPQFARQHIAGTINIPLGMLAGWAGWLVDYDRPLYLIAAPEQLPEAVRILRKLGMDNFAGVFDSDTLRSADLETASYVSLGPGDLRERIATEQVTLIDVRSQGEWDRGHIEQARHVFLGSLLDQGPRLPRDKPIVVQCQLGGRSAIAASIMQRYGADVINLAGGIAAWQTAGFPVCTGASSQRSVGSA